MYHYRGYATNTTGTAYTSDATFTTTSACGGYSYNGYCWYKDTVQNQSCGTFCGSHGSCINSTQNCQQDETLFGGLGMSCSWDVNSAFNNNDPGYNGGSCEPRTTQDWNCGTGNVTTAACTAGTRMYWYAICSCSS